jgi:hypothetical protein
MGRRPIKALILGLKKEFHTREFQAEIYAIKACIMGNAEKG